MIKILFLIHDLGQGGAEKVLVNLVNNLDRKKFDVTLISLFGGGINEQFLKKDVKYRVIYKKAFPGNSHIMKMFTPEQLHRNYIKEYYDIEVAFLEGPASRIISGCTNPDTKLISWTHCTMHSQEEIACGYKSYREAKKCMEKYHGNIFVSREVKDAFESCCKVKNAVVLHNVNESDVIKRKAQETVQEVQFRADDIKLVGVGKLEEVKGFDRLAKIQKRFVQEGYPVHTYILGEGSKRKELQEYLDKENLNTCFTLLGYQTNPYKFIRNCDIFVCSSYSEGFSTAVTESLIVGVPVVTTSVSGMSELLGENGEWGIITDNDEEALYEGIKKLVVESNQYLEYRQRAEIRGKDFSKESIMREIEGYFERIKNECH